ncbi:hypothetical protein KC19_VG298700 [Ceratodon purpureus]|uniref:Uncharacterized protein n=1 Tax=Ceratodon purpureus TaxID=3225 RepID=A0A8T0HV09_CERPU|nr:hypothetical protein KC19_VG298700 [Ceratodon purpureus]
MTAAPNDIAGCPRKSLQRLGFSSSSNSNRSGAFPLKRISTSCADDTSRNFFFLVPPHKLPSAIPVRSPLQRRAHMEIPLITPPPIPRRNPWLIHS